MIELFRTCCLVSLGLVSIHMWIGSSVLKVTCCKSVAWHSVSNRPKGRLGATIGIEMHLMATSGNLSTQNQGTHFVAVFCCHRLQPAWKESSGPMVLAGSFGPNDQTLLLCLSWSLKTALAGIPVQNYLSLMIYLIQGAKRYSNLYKLSLIVKSAAFCWTSFLLVGISMDSSFWLIL